MSRTHRDVSTGHTVWCAAEHCERWDQQEGPMRLCNPGWRRRGWRIVKGRWICPVCVLRATPEGS